MNLMLDRRKFLRHAAGTAAVLSMKSRFGVAALMAQGPAAAKTKVIVARDATLQAESPTESRVLALLDKAILTATDRKNQVEAWRFIGYPHIYKNRVIGLKVDGSSGRGCATRAALVRSICERLQQAGVSPGNIVIWDSNARNLEACGLRINTDHKSIRCFGSDVAGYEDHDDTWGSVRVRLSRILTRECALVINVPILKDHNKAGVAFSMMNLFSAAEHPVPLSNNGDPAVADFSCIPALRDKTSITIGDALSSIYDGGPAVHPNRLWYPNALIIGDDRVAVDHTAWQMLNRKRISAGLPTLEAAGRAPRYIHTAADTVHNLGTDDPKRINVVEV
jgi:uncharacterized protein (DUF362 family)